MNKEILSVVELVAYEKSLPREKIFEVLEKALSIVTRKLNTQEIDVRVNIDRESGDFNTFRRWKIVNKVCFPTKQITLDAAKLENNSAKLSEFIEYKIDSIPFDRLTIQVAKKIIIKKVREAERSTIINKFYNKKGKIITGIVKRITRYHILIDLGYYIDGIITNNNLLPKDKFSIGDQIKGIVYKIYNTSNNIKLFISRSKPQMLLELFSISVPEIRDKLVKIKSISRDPGVRSKISVKSYDPLVDPIGSCIGVKGLRVQTISKELCGERIDIILWNKNLIQFLINILVPVEVVSIFVHKFTKSMNLIINPKHLAQAIGKNGQNIRLSSRLIGWDLNVMTTHDLYSNHQRKIYKIKNIFSLYLNVKKNIVDSLIRAGISSLEHLVCISYSDLLKIKEMDQDSAYNIQNISNEILSNFLINKKIYKKNKKQTLLSLYGMNQDLLFQLYKKNIFHVETLADQNVYDLIDINELNIKKARALIMEARNMCWFNNKF